MPPGYFDYSSTEANFARIFERFDQQDKATDLHRRELKETIATFQTEQRSQDVRVRGLENSQWKQRGFIAAIGLGIPLLWSLLSGAPPKS